MNNVGLLLMINVIRAFNTLFGGQKAELYVSTEHSSGRDKRRGIVCMETLFNIKWRYDS